MKARNENGTIILYPVLPINYGSETLGCPLVDFNTMPTEVHESEGFFDVVVPEFDGYTQQLSPIFFDQENKIFTYTVEPLLEPILRPVIPQRLTYLEFFLGRFTENELEAIEEACEPIIPENRRLRMAMKYMEMATYIDPEEPRTAQFLGGLVEAGLITSQRANEIIQI
jgi:hypothetical protein